MYIYIYMETIRIIGGIGGVLKAFTSTNEAFSKGTISSIKRASTLQCCLFHLEGPSDFLSNVFSTSFSGYCKALF